MDSQTPAFLTGSRAYGTPTPKSDWDLVVLVDHETAAKLKAEFAERGASYVDSIRVGALNLILPTTRKRYDVWADGTQQLKARAPVTRDEAVELFQQLRAALAFNPKNNTEETE